MKILDLVVKHKWYDMEESGEKPEEYRALSDHWVKRFLRIDTGREGALRYLASLPTNQVWQDNHFALIEYWIRKLTPRECFRLMDVPEHYIDRLLSTGISNSQLYKLAGNSIVVACLFHIFRKMFCETARESGSPIAHSRETPAQLSLF